MAAISVFLFLVFLTVMRAGVFLSHLAASGTCFLLLGCFVQVPYEDFCSILYGHVWLFSLGGRFFSKWIQRGSVFMGDGKGDREGGV